MPETIPEKTESIFYKVFDSSINIIMAVSTIEDGIFIDVNKAFERTFGYSKDELLGRSSVEIGIVTPEARAAIKKNLLEKGKIEDFEIQFLTKNKDLRTLTLFGELISIDGEYRLFTIAHDITDLNFAKSQLENEKALLQAIFESTPDGFILKNLDSIYQKANKTFCNFFDVSKDKILGKTDFDFFTKDEALGFREEDKEIIETGETREYDRKFIRGNSLIWCQTKKTPVRDLNGSISGVLCSIRDITRKKRLEELLKSRLCISDYSSSNSLPDLFQKILSESERLTESNLSFFHFVDDENKRVHINTWSEKAMRDCSIRAYENSYSLEKAGIWADCIWTRKPVIHNDYPSIQAKKGLPTGHIPIIRELVVPVFEGERIVAVLGVGNKLFDYNDMDVEIVSELAKMAWDILTRKKTEEALKESRRALNTLVNNLPGTVFRCRIDRNWGMEYLSYGCLALTGYEPDEITNSPSLFFGDLIHPEDREKVWTDIQYSLVTKRAYETEYRLIHRDSSIKQVLERGTVVFSDDGEPLAIEGFIADITESKEKDYELRRFASAIHQIAEIIIITDEKGIIKYVNPTFENVTGYVFSEVIGQNVSILEARDSDESFVNELWQTILSGKKWHGRFLSRKKDGSLYTEEGSISPVFDEKGEIIEFVAVKRDITNEINLEERLFQAQKIEAIGSLAGGIAHDFNNILFPLIGFSDILQQDLPKDSHLQDYVSEIMTASLRARELVKQILAFSRQSNQERTIVRIQNILNEVVRFSKAALPSTINIKTFIDHKCRPVSADSTQIHQVAMNLITNALHAMEEKGGVLSISLDEVSLSPLAASDLSLEPGLYVRLTVTDTGYGIDPNIQEKIFDPYFTTKENGKGTGIGLAVVHGIVKSHGGSIELKSSPGQGAMFVIYLPCLMEEKAETKRDSFAPISGGNEKILVLDDEETIARMVRQMLERLGYSVTVRTSSIEALQLFKDDPDRFDLIITDMTMPNMTGDKFSAEIKRIRRNMPIIICTGFSEKMDADKARILGIDGFVFKPILQNELAEKIRDIFDKKRE